jgi:hypothetical protein
MRSGGTSRAAGRITGRAALPLALLLAAGAAGARPVPVFHPGGAGAGDSVVIEFPVTRSLAWRTVRAERPVPVPDASGAGADSTLGFGADSTRTAAGAARPAAAAATGPAPAPRALDALLLSGTKSISVELGSSRDVGLTQALDLTVRGRVAGDVEIAATLSDRRLPFEPYGDTRELEDLDRVSLVVRAPHAGATFGDFRLDAGRGEFARFSRQLEGVQGNARVGGATWDVAAASAKGERRSLEIRGEEGKQGPYALLAHGVGAAADGLVAGSERVWLDGAELRRGADADYVIDYGAATITFTTRRLVSAQSRIAIDFEAVTGRFRRSLYAASTAGRAAGSGEWYASYAREGDDTRAPVGADLTVADRAALAALGDSADGAAGRGVRYAGSGGGAYAWDASEPADAHWAHLGPGRGDYVVEFTQVGEGRGAYRDTLAQDGSRFYRYMGRNLGTYAPGGELPVPAARQLLDVGGSVRLAGALALEGEVARSGMDRNALSSLDDADNAGAAGRLALRLDTRPVSLFGASLGALRGRAALRSVGPRFRPLDRIDAAFEAERWNQAATGAGERRQELGLEYEPWRALRLSGDLGVREVQSGSRSVRRAAGAALTAAVAGALRWEEAGNAGPMSRGARTRTSAELARERGVLRPRVRFLEERIDGQEGDSVRARRSRELGGAIAIDRGPSLQLRGGYTRRLERRDADAGRTDARAGTWEAAATVRSGAALLLDLGVTSRRARDHGVATASDLASLALLAGNPGGPVSSEIRYDVTQLREPVLVRRIVFVGEGSGSYDANGNPRLGGGYDAVSGFGAPGTRSRATVQVRFDAFPGRSGGGGAAAGGVRRGAWRAFGVSTFLRLETLSRLALGRPRYAFSPGAYLDPGATLRGGLTARQSLDVAPRGARWDARVEAGLRRDLLGEYEAMRLRTDATDARLRLRAPLALRLRLTGSAVVDRSIRGTERQDGLPGARSELRGRGLDVEIARTLGPAWGVSLLGRARRDRDRAHASSQAAWAAGPSVRRAAAGRLRLDARALYARSSQRGLYAPSGLYLAPAIGPRVEYDLLGEYRLRDRVALSLSLQGQRRFRGPDAYTGSLELRSHF